MERRRSREHELRQPGSLLVIGPTLVLRTLLWCFVVLDFFFKSYNFFSFRVCRQFKRELWYTLVGLTHLNGEFNCRPRNR